MMTGNVLLPYTQHNITLPYLSYVHLYAYLDGPTGRPYDQSASTHESTHAHKQAHGRNLSVALFGIECSLAAKNTWLPACWAHTNKYGTWLFDNAEVWKHTETSIATCTWQPTCWLQFCSNPFLSCAHHFAHV